MRSSRSPLSSSYGEMDGQSFCAYVHLQILLTVHQPCRATSFDAYDGVCGEHPPGVVLCASSKTAYGVLASTYSNK